MAACLSPLASGPRILRPRTSAHRKPCSVALEAEAIREADGAIRKGEAPGLKDPKSAVREPKAGAPLAGGPVEAHGEVHGAGADLDHAADNEP
jgi:hypothetical protein